MNDHERMKKRHLVLTETERQALAAIVADGQQKGRVVKRAIGLLALDRGESLEAVAALTQVTNDTVRAWCKRYRAEGIAGLQDKPRPGRPLRIDGKQRAQITALACSEAPPGHARWSLRLLADKVVELGLGDPISHTQVRHILKKTSSSRICARPGVSAN
jgi:transposase